MNSIGDAELYNSRDQFELLERPVIRDPNYLGISKKLKAQKFLRLFNDTMKKGFNTGAFKNINDKY